MRKRRQEGFHSAFKPSESQTMGRKYDHFCNKDLYNKIYGDILWFITLTLKFICRC